MGTHRHKRKAKRKKKMKVFSWYLVGSLSALCYSKSEFNDDCVRDAILLFSQINEHKSNFMMAREITNLLQSEYSESGIVDFNFQCAVYDQADNAAIIGDAWKVDIPNMNNPSETTNKAAACVKGSKSVSKRVYKDPRWTLMPNMDLCQFYDSAEKCAKLMKISLG